LTHFQKRPASQLTEANRANPFVVTLATPFVEVHPADFGRRPFYIRMAMMVFASAPLLGPLLILSMLSLHADEGMLAFVFLVIGWVLTNFVFVPMSLWWIVGRAPARRNKIDVLRNATRLGELASPQRLLVIRAIDDEPFLTMALGA